MVKIYNGIDVSSYQGSINFDKVKAGGVDVVIIKAGEAYSKHGKFETYYNNARAAGMKIGAYWYSHATNTAEAIKEADACASAIAGKMFEYPIYLDVEEIETFESGKTSDIIAAFIERIKTKGFFGGFYCSTYFTNTYINSTVRNKYPAWIADYRAKCYYSGNYGMWQYGAKTVAGVQNLCDVNEVYADYTNTIKSLGLNNLKTEDKKSIDQLAHEVLAGKWGAGLIRKIKLKAAGYDYSAVQAKVNYIIKISKLKSVDAVAKEVIAGKWGAGVERRVKLTDAGYDYHQIQRRVNEIWYNK